MPSFHIHRGPRRIVCLTEEPTEILYALGEEDRIVGISAYTVRPPEAREDKPVVSAFIGGSVEKIAALEPDLVIGFSDIQADLARSLIAKNLPVLIFNQRSIQEILDVILTVGRIVGRGRDAEALVGEYVRNLDAVAARAEARDVRPRVYFEEWPDPMISAIEWVSELIALAGGDDVFAEKSVAKGATGRYVDSEELRAADPQIVMASWCGKPFDRAAFESRHDNASLTAVRNGAVHELPPEIILQPGPACLTDGVAAIEAIIDEWETS